MAVAGVRLASLLIAGLLATGCSRTATEAATGDSSDPNEVRLQGLKQRVEILRDRWGVPHIYAQNQDDLFFANGYINARDRLFQLDMWRRVGTGKLAEVLGPGHYERDRTARLFSYRGDWKQEWSSYSPDAYAIAVAFTKGVNAYIRSRGGKYSEEFRLAGYEPGLWVPEDVIARVAGLSISRNLIKEITHAQDVQRFGATEVSRILSLSPPATLTPPPGLNLAKIDAGVVREFSLMLAASPFAQGSNNWAVDGTRTESGKPLLASDPHRGLEIPSLRRTIHLVAPGWNAIGAGEPALPGIALGHNENIAFGFTITGTDQQDLYVERLNPANRDEYWHNGKWERVNTIHESIPIKGAGSRDGELRFTVHGPIIHEDSQNAYALRWVGLEPGGAGYLASLAAARAHNWNEFQAAIARFKVPSENMMYADTAGSIGMVVAGLTPVRKNHTGLLPVPGSGEYEWSGYLPADQLPRQFNPPAHFLATANNDIRTPGYQHTLTFEWGVPFRAQRVTEMLGGTTKFKVADFERMQYDLVSLPARRVQTVLRKWKAPDERLGTIRDRLLAWDARIVPESTEALVYELMFARLGPALFGPDLGLRADPDVVLRKLEAGDPKVAGSVLAAVVSELDRYIGTDMNRWQLARASQLLFRHPLNQGGLNRGPFPRGGDSYTVNAAGGNGLQYGEGASYRQIADLADWDRSVMTNTPGEVGNPASPHYSDLIEDWRAGRYHPMPYGRKAVEQATEERIILEPK